METLIRDCYIQYKEMLCFFAYKKLGDMEAAKDCVQEVFFRLLKNNITTQINKGYLIIAVSNECNSYIRTNGNRIRRDKVYTYDIEQVDVIVQPTMKIVETKRQVIVKFIRENYQEILPQKTRIVFEKCFLQGKSTSQVTKEIGCTQTTVSTLKNYSIKLLRQSINQKQYFKNIS